jgi:hypothetical protein
MKTTRASPPVTRSRSLKRNRAHCDSDDEDQSKVRSAKRPVHGDAPHKYVDKKDTMSSASEKQHSDDDGAEQPQLKIAHDADQSLWKRNNAAKDDHTVKAEDDASAAFVADAERAKIAGNDYPSPPSKGASMDTPDHHNESERAASFEEIDKAKHVLETGHIFFFYRPKVSCAGLCRWQCELGQRIVMRVVTVGPSICGEFSG